jgi:hypothetical protein
VIAMLSCQVEDGLMTILACEMVSHESQLYIFKMYGHFLLVIGFVNRTLNTSNHVCMCRPSLQGSSHAGALVGSSNRLTLALTLVHCTYTLL